MMKRYVGLVLALMSFAITACAEQMTVVSKYPLQYGEYRTLRARALGMPASYVGYSAALSPADAGFLGGPGTSASVNVHGDLNILETDTTAGDRYSKLHIGGTGILRVAPNKGSFGNDALRITAGPQIYISSNSTGGLANPLKVWGTFRSLGFRQNEYQFVGIPKPYIFMGAVDNFTADDTAKRALMASYIRNPATTTGEGDIQHMLYDTLFIEGSPIYLGASNVPGVAGNTDYVLVNTETPLVVDVTRIFQVNGSVAAGGFLQYSSAVFKTDIQSLEGAELTRALIAIENTPIYRFRYKDATDSKIHIGVIADETPQEMLSASKDALDLQDATAYLAAALKELAARNDALKVRLAKLEQARSQKS